MWKYLFLMCMLYGTNAQNSYVVILPSSIRPGLSLNIGVNILRSNGDVTVTASLQRLTPRVKGIPPLLPEPGGPIQGGPIEAKATISTASIVTRQGEATTINLQVPLNIVAGEYVILVEGSGGLRFSKEQVIQLQTKSVSVFIQTDKGIYKPGQTVHLRTFAVFPDLKPFVGTFDIEIFDPNSNKIKQWPNVQDDSNIIARDFALSDQPVMGKWKIRSTANGQVVERSVSVEEFVLPKFEVKIELPPFGLTRDQLLSGTIEAVYTFGESVDGTVNMKLRNDVWSPSKSCREPIVELLPFQLNGKTPFNVSISQLQHLGSCEILSRDSSGDFVLDGRTVRVEANVTESLTGNTRNGSNTVKFFEREFKLEWLPSNSKSFKPGLWYNAFLKVSLQDGRPIPVGILSNFVTIKLMTLFSNCEFLRGRPSSVAQRDPETPYPDVNMVVPADGIINWSNLIPVDADTVSLRAEFPGASPVTTRIEKMDSPSNSYIQANLYASDLRVGDEATFEILSTSPMDSFVYQIFSRGNMLSLVEVDANNRTTKFITIITTAQMAPNSKFIVHRVQPDGEILVDSISFAVEGIFENEVSIEVDRQRARPGQGVNIIVNADPNSMVNLLAVDQSILLLTSGNDVTPREVEREINSFNERPGVNGNPDVIFFRFPIAYGGTDASQIFQKAGVVVLTDAVIHKQRPCRFLRPSPFDFPIPGVARIGGVEAVRSIQPVAPLQVDAAPVEATRVRKLFPDTWLWTNQSAGVDGRATFSATVPDTITSWITSAFAMNSLSGLGVSQSTAKLEVFLPFFVSLNLPFSVVRGEEVVIQAIVFNFLDIDTDVDVTLARSDHFNNIIVGAGGEFVTTSADQVQRVQVKSGEAKSVFFPIVPTVIGNAGLSVTAQSPVAADALLRQLLVVAEGVPQEYTLSFLIDLTDTNQYRNTVNLPFPGEIVDGSKRVTVSALGDLMGPTVNNLDKLLRLPSGCGEQNMISFAPDVFILKYLSDTNQLTDAIRQKAINFLEIGYQKELTYQHKDGSFSAFGERDDSGSMWLSSFVLTSFIKAKPFIFIDDNVLRRTVDWIIRQQSKDGSFPEPGRVIHTEMQGGSGSGTALTAYVLTALLQKENISDSQLGNVQTAISNARGFLETQLSRISDTYSLAITTYALTLARSASAQSALDRLNTRAIVQDGLKRWEVPEPPTDPTASSGRFWRPPNSGKARNVELTAYVLLIQAFHENVTEGLSIAKWLTGQRNANGGFVSTQDTVVALEALSEFASLAFSPVFDVNIAVSADSFRHIFPVSSTNALILQTVNLSPIPTDLTVEATGSGISLLEISVSYNVHRDSQVPSFDIRSRITDETVNGFTLETCARYLKNDTSGMVVQETGIPAGFEADMESITRFKSLKRIETLDRKVVFYFDAVTSELLCVSMNVVRVGLVAKSQPVAIQIYQYYSPDSQVTVFYRSDVLSNTSFCDICSECQCPPPSKRKK